MVRWSATVCVSTWKGMRLARLPFPVHCKNSYKTENIPQHTRWHSVHWWVLVGGKVLCNWQQTALNTKLRGLVRFLKTYIAEFQGFWAHSPPILCDLPRSWEGQFIISISGGSMMEANWHLLRLLLLTNWNLDNVVLLGWHSSLVRVAVQ